MMGSDILFPVGLLVAYVIATTVYDLFFHPLAQTPGPFLARISSWPSFYHACKGDRHIWIWQCHQLYGSKIRVTPNLILFCSPEAFNDIYNTKSNVKKSNFYDSWPRNFKDRNTLNTTDPVLHAQKRRLLSLAFTERSFKTAIDIVARHIDRWNELMMQHENGAEWSPPRDMQKLSDYLLFDIWGDLMFGKSFESKESRADNRFKDIPGLVVMFARFVYPITKSPLLPAVVWLKPRGLNVLLEWMAPTPVKNYYDFVAETVTRGRAEYEKFPSSIRREDIFHYLNTAIDPETGKRAYNLDELLSETHLLVIAGRETTATTVSALFFYICKSDRVYRKLVREVLEHFASAEDIRPGASLNACTFLRACIDETLRIAAPGPSELPRVVLPGGMNIAGDYYPAGVEVGTAGWANGHNEEVFGDASIFRPERWIVSEEEGVTVAEVARLKNGFNPFSKGTGSCLGQQLAITELMMIIGRTLCRMEVRSERTSSIGEGRPELGWGRRLRSQYQLQDAYMAIRKGPVVQFKNRESRL